VFFARPTTPLARELEAPAAAAPKKIVTEKVCDKKWRAIQAHSHRNHYGALAINYSSV
jgi:hypothetical protein